MSALTSEDLEDLVLYARGLKKQYREDSKIKFRLIGSPLYPEKTFSETAGYDTGYNTAKYLPSGSRFYQLKDLINFGLGFQETTPSDITLKMLDRKTRTFNWVWRVKTTSWRKFFNYH